MLRQLSWRSAPALSSGSRAASHDNSRLPPRLPERFAFRRCEGVVFPGRLAPRPGLLCQSLSSQRTLRFYTQTAARGICLWRRTPHARFSMLLLPLASELNANSAAEITEQGEQTLSSHEQTSPMKDTQDKTTLACGHECTLYAGMVMSTSAASSCWSKGSTECCECMHTATEEPCIYIDGLGEQPCPRWQFYCAACVRRCAPDGGTMWDAGKMKRVLVFEPGTRTLMSAAPNAATQAAKVAAAAAAVTAAAAPAEWLGVARQTLQAVKLAEQAVQAEPVLVHASAAATTFHRKRSQPTARKPRHPELVRDGGQLPTHVFTMNGQHIHVFTMPIHVFTMHTPCIHTGARRRRARGGARSAAGAPQAAAPASAVGGGHVHVVLRRAGAPRRGSGAGTLRVPGERARGIPCTRDAAPPGLGLF